MGIFTIIDNQPKYAQRNFGDAPVMVHRSNEPLIAEVLRLKKARMLVDAPDSVRRASK